VFSLSFHCRNIYFWYISLVYSKIHMCHIFNMKCTVLLEFSCVFTVSSLQKHVLLVHYTCIYQNTHVPYIQHEMHSFASFFMCFHCRNMSFSYISHVYIKILNYHIFKMKCKDLLVFSCVFTVFLLQKHVLLVHFTFIYQNTHVTYIQHEMQSFASVFMCYHFVFSAETCTFGTFHIFIPKYTSNIYST
jgi:hypothetical protein